MSVRRHAVATWGRESVAPTARDRGFGSVAVVGDDGRCRGVVATNRRRADNRSLDASTDEETLGFAERDRTDAVVLDAHLPGISERELCRKLGAVANRTPVRLVPGEPIGAGHNN